MKEKAITLISLVITIIILIVLAGISIVALTGENGLISKVNEARKESEESSAREKLELVLMNANTEKESNSSYNSQEYLTNMLENEGMTVNGDTILVDKYNFLIDREKLIILDGLGETTVTVAQEVKEYLGKNADDKYEANILIKISSNVGISKISIEGDSGNIIEMDALGTVNEIGKDMTVELDKEYKIIVTSFDGKETVSKIIEKSEEKISTVDNLMAFRDEVNKGLTYEGKTITLTEDINLSSICGKDIGNWVPIGNSTNQFKGTFDGNNRKISNLYINTTENFQGLFGKLDSKGIIKNVIVEGSITLIANSGAGIVGVNYGMIENCGNFVNISCYYHSGGIAGVNNGIINKCYNKGKITALKSNGGGITGTNGAGDYGIGINGEKIGHIYNCYNNAKVSGSNSGGIIGYSGPNSGKGGRIYNSYSIQTTTIVGNSGNGLDSKNNFTTNSKDNIDKLNSGIEESGTDIEQPWISDLVDNPINGGYPILKWQTESE